MMLAGAFFGCHAETAVGPAGTSDTIESTSGGSVSPADTEPPVQDIPAYDREIVADYAGFSVTVSAPTVVFQSTGDEQGGSSHHSFPKIRRTVEGALLAHWQFTEDKVGGKSAYQSRVSVSNGKSWVHDAGGFVAAPKLLMSNGKYFAGFHSYGTPVGKHLEAYTPVVKEGGPAYQLRTLYYAEDVADDPKSREIHLTDFNFYEYDPETKTSTLVPCTVNWPYAPIVSFTGGYAYSLSGWFGLSGDNVIVAEDGTLFTCIYGPGFDSFAESKEAAATDYALSCRFHVFVFASEDCGRTWNLTAQLTPGAECPDPGEGYCEPKMIQMPDGSLFMLMRTGSNNPMYVTRSTDGVHWTTPAVFDSIGVLPQLARFGCGVTMTSYGRPYLRICLTDDPTGETWEKPIEIPLPGPKGGYNQSCFYTSLEKIDENTYIMIYSSRCYPNRSGVAVPSMLTRTITVTPHESIN